MASIKASASIALVASAMALTPAVYARPAATNVAATIADPSRPAEDRALDASRHPAEILKLLNLKHGKIIADIWPGDYWDRLFAHAVGQKGTVYAVHLPAADKAENVATPADGSTPVASHANIIALSTAPTAMILPKKADVIWIRQNYHDLYDPFMGPVDVPAFNKAVYRALKPGGRFVIIDHIAPAGSKLAATDTTHRIDPAVVKADMAAAGFALVGESSALRNPGDPHTTQVFDPSIRGHTDQFIYVFKRKSESCCLCPPSKAALANPIPSVQSEHSSIELSERPAAI